jgi:FO synthase
VQHWQGPQTIPPGLSDVDHLRLLEADGPELDALAALADNVRAHSVGAELRYVVNRNINFTNVCYTGCRFCAFAQRSAEQMPMPMPMPTRCH